MSIDKILLREALDHIKEHGFGDEVDYDSIIEEAAESLLEPLPVPTGIGAAIHNDNPLFVLLDDLGTMYRGGEFEGYDSWMHDSDFGTHELSIRTDDEDDEYLLVGFCLPDNVYVETDHDTYGALFGFRIYREET